MRIAPATGMTSEPLASAKAIAGFSRAGSALRRAAALAAMSAALARSAAAGRFHLGDQIFEICRLIGELGGAVALGGERLLGLGQRLLARLDQRGEPHLVGGQRRRALREVVALLGDRGAQIGELGEVGAQSVGLALQRFDHRAEQGGGANRLGHVLRPDRIAGGGSRPIRCSTASTSATTARRLSSERVSASALRVEAVEALVGGGDLPFGVLHLGGGVDQRRVEPGPVGAQRFDVGLDLAALLVGGADRVLDPAQALLRRSLVVGRVGGRRGRGGPGGGGRWGGGGDWARAGNSASASAPSAVVAAITTARALWSIAACLESVAMIGMPAQDGKRAIELLGGHHPDELVRPGHRAEIDERARFRLEGGIEPVGTADQPARKRRPRRRGRGRSLPPIGGWSAPRRARRATSARRLWGRRRGSRAPPRRSGPRRGGRGSRRSRAARPGRSPGRGRDRRRA